MLEWLICNVCKTFVILFIRQTWHLNGKTWKSDKSEELLMLFVCLSFRSVKSNCGHGAVLSPQVILVWMLFYNLPTGVHCAWVSCLWTKDNILIHQGQFVIFDSQIRMIFLAISTVYQQKFISNFLKMFQKSALYWLCVLNVSQKQNCRL